MKQPACSGANEPRTSADGPLPNRSSTAGCDFCYGNGTPVGWTLKLEKSHCCPTLVALPSTARCPAAAQSGPPVAGFGATLKKWHSKYILASLPEAWMSVL